MVLGNMTYHVIYYRKINVPQSKSKISSFSEKERSIYFSILVLRKKTNNHGDDLWSNVLQETITYAG